MDATQRKVVFAIEDCMGMFCDKMQEFINKEELTEEEILVALGGYPDFQDVWIDWMTEND